MLSLDVSHLHILLCDALSMAATSQKNDYENNCSLAICWHSHPVMIILRSPDHYGHPCK